jgi:hypothetical protein
MRGRPKKKVRGNPIAKDLRTPKYTIRVVKSKKVYDRKRVSKVDLGSIYGTHKGAWMFVEKI